MRRPTVQHIHDERARKETAETHRNEDFVQISRSALATVRDVARWDTKANTVLWFLIENMSRSNTLEVTLKELCRFTGWSRPTVTDKLRKLADWGCIAVYRDGRRSVYAVNANLAWTTWGDRKNSAMFRGPLSTSGREDEWCASRRVRFNKRITEDVMPRVYPLPNVVRLPAPPKLRDGTADDLCRPQRAASES